MRITKDTVRKLADWAAEVSGGKLGLQSIGNPGDGLRYVDAHQIRVFKGKTATREAALFYGFAGHEWSVRDGVYPPAWVDEILLELLESPASVVRAGDDGLDHTAQVHGFYRPTLRAVA